MWVAADSPPGCGARDPFTPSPLPLCLTPAPSPPPLISPLPPYLPPPPQAELSYSLAISALQSINEKSIDLAVLHSNRAGA